ncbi:hypothetical protein Tco_1202668 [Tanacetum coccineum]
MVPIHHSPDQVVVGASALSLALDISSSCVRKIKKNIANYISALRDVFVPLAEPLSFMAVTGTEGTSNVVPATADITTALSTTVMCIRLSLVTFINGYLTSYGSYALSIIFKTPPKNYKDTYDEVDEEFSTVIYQHNDNILPRVDRRYLGNVTPPK